jgi:hypothetical protein
MNQGHDSKNEECLSPETVMAFLDGELERAEAAAVQSHLDACARCRQMAEELATASRAVAIHLTCLDDESMAAYVDHQAGRVRGAVDEAEIQRIRTHLDRCERCREEVGILAQACRTRVGVLGRLSSLLVTRTALGRPAMRPALRWAAVTVVVVAMGVLAFLGLRGRGPGPVLPGGSEVVEAPIAPTPEPGVGAREEPPSEVPAPEVEPGIKVPGPQQKQPTPRPELSTEMALVSGLERGRGDAATALRALTQARENGDAGAQARSAMGLAGIYHQNRNYASAARYYREAAGAAEKAGEAELRVDSLVLLGAALAEMGETQQARQQFGLALELARQIGYETGETNALVQLRVLGRDSAEGEG